MKGSLLRLFAVLALGAGLLMPLGSSAQIYRWTDEDGTVHFSDTPVDPDNADAQEEVDIVPNYVPPPRTQAEIDAMVARETAQAESGRRRREALAREEEAATEERNREKLARCAELDDAITRYGTPRRIYGRLHNNYLTNENGESISEAEQEAIVADMRRQREALGCP